MIIVKWIVFGVLILQGLNCFIVMVKTPPKSDFTKRLGGILGYISNFLIRGIVLYVVYTWNP